MRKVIIGIVVMIIGMMFTACGAECAICKENRADVQWNGKEICNKCYQKINRLEDMTENGIYWMP